MPRQIQRKARLHKITGDLFGDEPVVATYAREYGSGNIGIVVRKDRFGNERKYYRARVWTEDDKGVRRRIEKYAKTELLAERAIRKLVGGNTATVDATKITLNDYMSSWLRGVRAHNRPATYRQYETIVRLHLAPRVGRAKLGLITSANLRALMNELSEMGVGSSTRRNAHKILTIVLNLAVSDDLIGRNPMGSVPTPKIKQRDTRVPTLDEAKRLLASARNTKFFPLIYLAMTTGMRQGELFALRWDDVYLDQGYIQVRHTLTEDLDGKLGLTEPKTQSSKRRIELDTESIKLLVRSKKDQDQQGYTGQLVFPSNEGSFIRKSNFSRRIFRPLLAEAGLTDLKFHSLRHFANSWLLAQGTPIKTVQERGGWSSVRMPLDIYGHAIPGDQRRAADSIGMLIKGLGGKLGGKL